LERGRQRRILTLLAVLLAHAALFVALSLPGRVAQRAGAVPAAVELTLVQPLAMPALRASTQPLRPSSRNTLVRIGATDLDSFAPRLALPAAGAVEGSGSGVDWAAEARRALQAYEIRKRQPQPYDVAAGEPAEEGWWPRAQHHAGQQFKTAAGDWIVWINDDCYQIATPVVVVSAPGAMRSETVCRERPR
jgi:hypothetical protein